MALQKSDTTEQMAADYLFIRVASV